MKKSLLLKIFSGHLLVIIVIASIGILLFSNFIYKFYIKQLNNQLFGIAQTMRPYSEIIFDKGFNLTETDLHNLMLMESFLNDIANKLEIRITLIDPQGNVVFDTEMDAGQMDNHLNRAEIIESLKEPYGYSIRRSTSIDLEMLYHAINIETDGKKSGFIRISMPIIDVYDYIRGFIYYIIFYGILIIGISLSIAYIISKGISKKIMYMKVFFDKIASGVFDMKIIPMDDELKDLHDSINKMLSSINDNIRRIKDKKAIYKIIEYSCTITAMIDRSGNIIVNNTEFKQLFGSDSMGRKYWDVFRDANLNNLIENVQKNDNIQNLEVRFKDKNYLAHIIHIIPDEELLLFLYDLSNIKYFEKYKKEIYNNISHELKTPLTAIKGFAETLYEEVGEEHKNYIDIIHRHANRLNHIVQDLITINDLEEYRNFSSFRRINLKELLDSVIPIFENNIAQKGLILLMDIEDDLPLIYADSNKMEQLFINLIDNAVKYTMKGNIKISIKKQTDNSIFIEIADTGIGIKKQDIPRVFERFFVGDKNRSKNTGGSGLGLSIVKKIITLHNGTIDIDSQLNHGTTVSIILPIDNNGSGN